MGTILDIQDIHKSFTAGYAGRKGIFGRESKSVIRGLDLKLEKGKATALVGGNGAGKTSLFNLISGLIRPDNGSIIFHGDENAIDCTQATPWTIASAGVGRMFQGARIFDSLRVKDHLVIQVREKCAERPFYNIHKPVKSKRVQADLEQKIKQDLRNHEIFSELLRYYNQPASSLSFAQQRLLSMAGLVIGNYKLIMLDEPSSGMSPETFEPMTRLISSLVAEGRSVFLIEHNMDFIRNAISHCHYMAEGRIIYSGKPEEVLNKEEVRQSYLL